MCGEERGAACLGRKQFDQSGAKNESAVQTLLELWKNGISSQF